MDDVTQNGIALNNTNLRQPETTPRPGIVDLGAENMSAFPSLCPPPPFLRDLVKLGPNPTSIFWNHQKGPFQAL